MFEQPIDKIKQQWVPRLLSVLPAPSPLPGLIGRAMLKRGDYTLGQNMPQIVERKEGVLIDADHLARYRSLCGFRADGPLPATYLALLSFTPTLRIMLNKAMPLPVMGQIHLRNRVAVLAEFDHNAPLDIEVAIGRSNITAAGLEWDIDCSVYAEGVPVWKATATSLHRCTTGVPRQRGGEKVKFDQFQERQALTISAELGRQYARLSGDFNPIHLADVTANLFGFKQAIIHGMWTKARALAALQEVLPSAGYSAEVKFIRPIALPSEVQLGIHYAQNAGQQLAAFAVAATDCRAIHLHGECQLLEKQ